MGGGRYLTGLAGTPMIKLMRGLFFVAAVALFITAAVFYEKTNEPDNSSDYTVDWQNDLGGSMQAVMESQRQSALRLDRIHEYQEVQGISTFFAIVCALAFIGLCLPWDRIAAKPSQKASNVAFNLGKITGQAAHSIKEMTGGSPIVGRHGLTSYSVADELMKWNELRETGVVTEEEFAEARALLLKRDTTIDV